MDNLNAALAYAYQDAFENVYNSIKEVMANQGDEDNVKVNMETVFVDTAMQKKMADETIDRIASNAISLVLNQPEHAQESAASVWITGAAIVADCMGIALREMTALESQPPIGSPLRVEAAWNIVKASVVSAITGLKGIFSLMDTSSLQSCDGSRRHSSIASASAGMLRRLSNAFTAPSSGSESSRRSSVASLTPVFVNSLSFDANRTTAASEGPIYRMPSHVRGSASKISPTSMQPSFGAPGFKTGMFAAHHLSTVPQTPSHEKKNPFDCDPGATGARPLPPLPSPEKAVV